MLVLISIKEVPKSKTSDMKTTSNVWTHQKTRKYQVNKIKIGIILQKISGFFSITCMFTNICCDWIEHLKSIYQLKCMFSKTKFIKFQNESTRWLLAQSPVVLDQERLVYIMFYLTVGCFSELIRIKKYCEPKILAATGLMSWKRINIVSKMYTYYHKIIIIMRTSYCVI